MSDSPAGRPPPPFAVELIERAMDKEPDHGLEPWAARLIAATLAADGRPALDEFARTGRLRRAEVRGELATVHHPFRPTWLAALHRFVEASPAADDTTNST